MPTGYTQCILSDDEVTFEKFARGCARAMGAFSHQRDDDQGTKLRVPKKDSYYTDYLEEVEEKAKKYEAWSDEDWTIYTDKINKDSLRCFDSTRVTYRDELYKYNKMLEKVNDWKPPTDEYIGFKDFMITQIKDSIKFDCHKPELPDVRTVQDCREQVIERVARDLKFYGKKVRDEEERYNKNVKFITVLFESIGE